MSNDLNKNDMDKIKKLEETASIISTILNTDVFIDCATRDEMQALVIYHAKPKAGSIYSKNITGEIATAINEPAVFRSLMTGKPSKNYKAINQENQKVLQNVIPIKNREGRTIAVIIVEVKDSENFKIDTEMINKNTINLIKNIDNEKEGISDFIKDGVVVFNEQGKAVYTNEMAEKIYSTLGLVDSIIGKKFENISLTKTKFENILLGVGTKEVMEVSIALFTLNISYHLTKFENSGVVMIVSDVTKEKNDKKEIMLKSVAIKEIHHRVKNNLQTVASLLRMQTRRLNNDEAKQILKDTTNRILSIAVTHEILSDNGFNDINVQTMIKLLYDNFEKTSIDKKEKILLNIRGDNYNINSETSTAIALVVSEILQNIVNHAFVKNKDGIINIKTSKKTLFFEIEISDNGVGMEVDKTRDSLGMIIINKIISDKLKGKVYIVSKKNEGTTIKLEFKNI